MLWMEIRIIAMLDEMIIFFSSGSDDLSSLIKISFYLVALKTISTLISRQFHIYEIIIGYESVYQLQCFIFDKILKVTPSSRKTKSDEGSIINYLLVDSPKFSGLLNVFSNIVICPIQIIIYIVILFNLLGVSFIFGMTPLVGSSVMNYLITKNYDKSVEDLMIKKDKCMKATTEIFDSLKLLKMYGWEDEFKKRVILSIYVY
jgi:ATP-binding cassette subfamily C (CFTR/MRP) protein 2